MKSLIPKIQSVLTPDLLKSNWKHVAAEHPHAGHCYAASEALFHLGAKSKGFRPAVLNATTFPTGLTVGQTHWFLRNAAGHVLDATAGQFDVPIPYVNGIGCGFLTKQPSKRAQTIIQRL